MNFKRLIFALFVLALLIAFIIIIFSNIKMISLVYFLFGILAIFSSTVYIQIHLSKKERSPPVIKEYPSISILIPNYNSAKTLEKCLHSISNLNYPKNFTVYLIDDGSTDESVKIAENFIKEYEERKNKTKNKSKIKIKFKIIKNEKNIGKAASLNKGLREAKSEVVACIDSDTYPKEDVLLKMVPYLYTNEKTIAVTGFIVAANPKNLLQRVQELEYYGAFGFAPKMMVNINGIMVIPGPMSVLKRKEVLDLGGFDEKNLTEDMEIGLRMHKEDYIIEYCPDAIIPTEVPDTLYKLYRQRIRWYRGTIFNLNKYKEMMLNPNYKDFGMFSYPSCFFYVVFTILTFSILLFYLLKDILFRLQTLAIGVFLYSIEYIKYIDMNTPLVFTSAFIVFFFVFLALWFYYLIYSVKQAKARLNLKQHLPAALFVIIIYPTLISIFYIISFLKELLGESLKW